MATKDWKKQGTITDDNGDEIILYISHRRDNFYPAIEIRNTKYGKWTVYLLDTPTRGNKVLKDKFKTKSQAIKFAKDYMRKH